MFVGHPGGSIVCICMYTQWWLWEDWDVYCCQHTTGAAQDRGGGGCLQHCPKPAPPAFQHGPKCGKTSIS